MKVKLRDPKPIAEAQSTLSGELEANSFLTLSDPSKSLRGLDTEQSSMRQRSSSFGSSLGSYRSLVSCLHPLWLQDALWVGSYPCLLASMHDSEHISE